MEPAERREQIKLRIEYVKLAVSIIGTAALVFAGLQWRASNQAANQSVYQVMAKDWRDHLKLIAEHPEVRRYLEEKQMLPTSVKERSQALAFADIRLDTMDAILTYAAMRDPSSNIQGWRNTFASAFSSSSVLCHRLLENKESYGLIVQIGVENCQ